MWPSGRPSGGEERFTGLGRRVGRPGSRRQEAVVGVPAWDSMAGPGGTGHEGPSPGGETVPPPPAPRPPPQPEQEGSVSPATPKIAGGGGEDSSWSGPCGEERGQSRRHGAGVGPWI